MDWMIYGANGYTGELIAREAKKRGAVPVIAGRDAAKIAELATDLSLPSKVFSLDAPIDVAAALAGVGLVLNCAGLEFGDQEWTSRARGGSQLLLAASIWPSWSWRGQDFVPAAAPDGFHWPRRLQRRCRVMWPPPRIR